jgi:hypothetical protein
MTLLIPAIDSTVVLPIVQAGLTNKTTAAGGVRVASMNRNYDKQNVINFSDKE